MSAAVYSELSPVLEAVEILSADSFRFAGEPPVQASQSAVPPGYSPYMLPNDPLVQVLQAVLYARCYSQRLGHPPEVPEADPQLVERLSRANRTQDRWEPGWRIYQMGPNGQAYVIKGECQRSAMPGEYVTFGVPGLAPRVGSEVTLRVTRESLATQPGFFFMYSDTLSDIWDDYFLVRYYFHCRPGMVADLVDYLSASLNRYLVPYHMKALTDASQYTRTDAAVLYCARRHFRVVAWILRHLPESVRSRLRPPVPLFSRRLGDGIGLAEDPSTGESFGMHRCRLTAEGLVDAWRQGARGLPERMRAVATRFALNGLDLARPHLGAGLLDDFDIAEGPR